MKILHTADWHIGNFPGPEKDGRNLRADDTGMCINHLHDIALLEKPDMILVSGDLFHQARVWADRGLHEVEVAIRALTALSKICPVVVMRGTPNHDGSEQFSMLEAHFYGDDSVHIITDPTVFQLTGYRLYSKWVNIACLPGFDRGVFRAKFPGLSKEEENQVFTEELGKIVLALRAQCDPALPTVLMSHYTVPGCNTESGQTQFLTQFEPVLLPETLDAASFDLVALGHIHRPQQLETCRNAFYSGAINAFNFNDEGQERGFWIHDLDAGTHTFHKTPAREFVTIRMTQTDIDGINAGVLDEVAHNWWGWDDGVKGKIVRVLYSCTEEAHKAFNRSILEKQLYADGAFWVSEISPEQVTVGTNKDELSERTDPERNLRLYLDEKGLPDADVGEIVESARPIIAAATASTISSQFSGAFLPISIEVKNYRNYVEASFDFTDISFCTINGVNGAGKSSLFMDAILDCLFEEPREGDLTGWIRADEKARSGYICFTFAIGEHIFRVTRTRAKSGKATLNISEKVADKWENRSLEKIKDTQARIENILGMDSLTFRSCALIMQDQYGLFLQASKEERMAILGNILGLGVYGAMEQISRNCATDANRSIAQRKTVINTLSLDIAGAESLESEYVASVEKADTLQKDIERQTLLRENLSLKAATLRDAAEKARKVEGDVSTFEQKQADLGRNKAAQEETIRMAREILSREDDIHMVAENHRMNAKEEQRLKEERSAVVAKLDAASSVFAEITSCENEIRALASRQQSTTNHRASISKRIADAAGYKDAAEELARVQASIKTAEELEASAAEANAALRTMENDFREKKAAFDTEAATRKAKVEHYQAKAQMLADSQCVDVENAHCRFLADARAAKEALEAYLPECTKWKTDHLEELDTMRGVIEGQQRTVDGIGFDPSTLSALRARVETLRGAAQEYENMSLLEDMVAADDATLAQIAEDIDAKKARLYDLDASAKAAEALNAQKRDLDISLSELSAKLSRSVMWLEREAEIPLAKEREAAAQKRIAEIEQDIETNAVHITELRAELAKLNETALSGSDVERQLTSVKVQLSSDQRALATLQGDIGGLRERLSKIEERKAEISENQEAINRFSRKVFIYETLKVAFSQDGIPHNIIRSMLPLLTSTANTILGQMTGGKMGMEFVTDKVLKSNSKKEVPTLDIIIEEYGKDSLPYLSKSGGEKVKASLSAILSLAEIKSSQAGIQLGMLFIDEPPFLDTDGIQAYCDALETIQRRYSSLKVMAITHDPTMKARFPQSIDIIKTDAGSRVELG